jgi:sortase (surface protein transpeptidase)
VEFCGSDYVTIKQIDLSEAAANTTATTQMEVGYGFYKASATNGANNLSSG